VSCAPSVNRTATIREPSTNGCVSPSVTKSGEAEESRGTHTRSPR
jgi:hypothetical protein